MALPSGHSSNCRWRRAQPGLNYTLIGTSLLLVLSDKVKVFFCMCVVQRWRDKISVKTGNDLGPADLVSMKKDEGVKT